MTTPEHAGTHATLANSGDNTNSQELPQGSNFGRYVIIEPIGSGGMGIVYRAYDPQLNRGVALKILSVKHADLQASERAKARLIREAQALAQLSHPNVVAVHDAGTFKEDVYIAMEMIEGKTLDEWMRQERRPIKEILRVMIAAGQGLSAAHKAGLVHRDFKPGNVIVGADGRVRVLDFGLARATDQQKSTEEGPMDFEQDGRSQGSEDSFDWKEISSDSSPNLLQSPLTHDGGVLGTPLYMAPEQHLGLKTDERTDQFGFCVVLYEVLYGKRPFVAGSMEKLKSKVIRQQVSVPRTESDVAGWLWQIVGKGLSAKPEDRYATIDSLLEELGRDPEAERRQKRLANRRRLVVISLVLLTIVTPIGVWYGLRYRTFQLCKNAEGEFDGVWDESTKASVRIAFLATEMPFALATWERVKRSFDAYLTDWTLMRSNVCETRLISGMQSEELFDLRMSCLEERKQEMQALTEIFAEADSGVAEKAVQAASSLTGINICANEKALRAPFPPPNTEKARAKVAAFRNRLAEVTAFEKTGQYREGLSLVTALEKKVDAVGYKPVRAEVLYRLGSLLDRVGEYNKAEKTLNEAERVASECRDALLTSKTMTILAKVVGYSQDRHKEGLSLGRSAESMLRIAGGDDWSQSQILNNIGAIFKKQAEYNKALAYYQIALELRLKVLGPEHPDIAYLYNNIGNVYRLEGMYAEALDAYLKTLAIRKKTLGNDHPAVADSLGSLGTLFWSRGDYQKALDCYRKTLVIREKFLGSEHPSVSRTLNNLGGVYENLGEHNKALEQYRKSLAIKEKTLGTDNPSFATTLVNLGYLYWKKSEHDKALEHFLKALNILEKTLEPEHPIVAWSLNGIGNVFLDQGKPKQALVPLERVVTLCEKKTCEHDPYGRGLFGLARALVRTGGDKKRAIKLAKQSQELLAKTPRRFEKEIEMVNIWLREHGEEKLAKTVHE